VLTQRLAVALALPVLVLAACDGEEPKASTETGSPTVAGIDYPDEGVDLVDRPELKGVYQQALQTYVDFERGRRLAAREGKVGRLLSFNATARVVDPYREALAASGSLSPYAGDVVIEFLGVQTRDSVLRIDICVDATALEVPDDGPTLLGEATRAPQRIEVTNIVGPWRVTEAEPVDGSC
jgi:hypothetical protein